MKYIKSIIKILLAASVVFIFFSCQSVQQKKGQELTISRRLLGEPVLNAQQLADYFVSVRTDADKEQIVQFAQYYIEEAAKENINSDCAFAQMCLETGYLSFGNLVVPEMHNYCGLGAMDEEHPGEWFETEQLGVRAHIQHLQAYATTEDVPLNQELIDPRYRWVHRTKFAETIFDLAGVWATDKLYGEKIDSILSKMEMMFR